MINSAIVSSRDKRYQFLCSLGVRQGITSRLHFFIYIWTTHSVNGKVGSQQVYKQTGTQLNCHLYADVVTLLTENINLLYYIRENDKNYCV